MTESQGGSVLSLKELSSQIDLISEQIFQLIAFGFYAN